MDLAHTSLFLLWIGLSSAAVLCYGRFFLERFSQTVAAALALALLVVTTGLISEFAWWLETYWDQFIQPQGPEAVTTIHATYLLRNMLVTLGLCTPLPLGRSPRRLVSVPQRAPCYERKKKPRRSGATVLSA